MKVRDFLDEQHVPYEYIAHEPTYDAQHMAHAIHVKGRAVAKCVLLRANHGYRYMTAILPATRKIDFGIASRLLGHAELRLASGAEVSEVCPDCEAGILLPFGSQYGVTTLVDSSFQNKTKLSSRATGPRSRFV